MSVAKWVAGVAALALAVGCSTTKTSTSEKTAFEVMQAKATEITGAGGIAAVGMGQSKVINMALDRAKDRGRAEIARVIEVKVDNLQKDFSEEIGEGEGSEFNSLFSNATKMLASQVLRGTVPQDLKYDIKDGMVTGYALMVQDPKIIADAFANQANTQRQLYTRFRASQAFEEMDKEIQKFEEYKKTQSGVVQ